MDVRQALKEQYHASLAMLAESVERCPEALWTAGAHPRAFWQIAFHAAFYAHLYMGQNEQAFERPPADLGVARRKEGERLWTDPACLEPYELPQETAPYARRDILEYIGFVDAIVDRTVDGLDLDSPDSGFPWYESFPKLSHELMSIRHVQGHVGQLSELLMARGIDTDWVGKAASASDD